MKIVMVTNGRPELTAQTIRTLWANADNPKSHLLAIVFDGECTNEWFEQVGKLTDHHGLTIYSTMRPLGVGGAKNYGVGLFSPGAALAPEDVLMFSDNDMYYLPHWDTVLLEALDKTHAVQIGGWKHPYHGLTDWGVGFPTPWVRGVDAVTGNCFVIKYSDWLKYGPFDSNALGPGQSEDYALSRKIIKAGGLVGTVNPPVAIHCGLRDSAGNPATGWQEMARMAEVQMEENGIESIWLDTPDEGTIKLEKAKGYIVRPTFCGLNVGSGQRRFDTAYGWTNCDVVSRPPDQVPDVVVDANKLDTKFEPNSQDMVVLHHVIEHFGCGEADEVIRQCYKSLKPGGSLLLFVPDMKKLAGRWLSGEIDTFTFFVNTYGAYQGEEGDRHKWGFTYDSLLDSIEYALGSRPQFIEFDWREIPGANIAKDWWILGVEVVKV